MTTIKSHAELKYANRMAKPTPSEASLPHAAAKHLYAGATEPFGEACQEKTRAEPNVALPLHRNTCSNEASQLSTTYAMMSVAFFSSIHCTICCAASGMCVLCCLFSNLSRSRKASGASPRSGDAERAPLLPLLRKVPTLPFGR